MDDQTDTLLNDTQLATLERAIVNSPDMVPWSKVLLVWILHQAVRLRVKGIAFRIDPYHHPDFTKERYEALLNSLYGVTSGYGKTHLNQVLHGLGVTARCVVSSDGYAVRIRLAPATTPEEELYTLSFPGWEELTGLALELPPPDIS